ncbi:hypothetical protein AVEN_187131-1 [Araneus ventricosus]|uniref:Uncharacterized protein n=1 Tax=Araneus ventricosus TaxID=182803 RepID=A0A4Y2KDG4_ARAVE|nr:hypothetical protein AVEN_187131-1 [Araneus ventricosus]
MQVIHVGSKVRYRSSPIPPIPPLSTRRISDFLPSSRGPNLGKPFDVPLASYRGLKLESTHEVMDFELFGIPPLKIISPKFHMFFDLGDCFFLPVFQKFHFGMDVNGPL